MRQTILKTLYKMFPFDLKGDCDVPPSKDGIRISCVINFYGRLDLLTGILHSLAQQDFPKDDFEVVLVEDQGGTQAGREMCESFSDEMQIIYRPLDKNFGQIAYGRNFSLALTRGEIVLYLDDDTTILQSDFLSRIFNIFSVNPTYDAVIPRGMASFAQIVGRYDFHDPYFMTNRCMAFRRLTFSDLGGFVSAVIGQEDVEFAIRFHMAGKTAERAPDLCYYHPPLLVSNLRKPMAVGKSFYQLKSRYPWFIWILVIVNGGRHAPLILAPFRRMREMGRFGFGFLLGVLCAAMGKKGFSYSS